MIHYIYPVGVPFNPAPVFYNFSIFLGELSPRARVDFCGVILDNMRRDYSGYKVDDIREDLAATLMTFWGTILRCWYKGRYSGLEDYTVREIEKVAAAWLLPRGYDDCATFYMADILIYDRNGAPFGFRRF